MDVAIPLLTALVALLFALSVLDQYLERRRPYQLIWTVGLLLYGLASLMSMLWAVLEPNGMVFRLWYYSGGMLVAAYLGMGSIYLAAPRRTANVVMGVLAALTVVGGVLVFSVGLRNEVSLLAGEALSSRVEVDGGTVRFFPVYVSLITIFLNIAGSVALVGGALSSAWRFWRRRVMGYRVVSNVLIATGAFVSAAGGTLDAFGIPDPHAVALLLGVVIIYIGFLRSREVFQAYRVPFLGRTRAG